MSTRPGGRTPRRASRGGRRRRGADGRASGRAKDYLPLTDDVFARASPWRADRRDLPAAAAATPARCSRATSTRVRGRSTRSPTSTPATPTVSPPRWSDPGRATAPTCGCSSTASSPASTARAMGAALLRQAMAARAELDLTSYDRFFPSQDFMPKAGFGNLIALPLQGECAHARQHAVPRSDDDGAVAGPVGVPLVGRSHVARRGRGPGAIAPPGRRRTGAHASRSWPRRGGPASPDGDPGPARGDVVDRAGRAAAGGRSRH